MAALAHPPKAVILGNHDAWFSLTPNGRRRYARALAARSALPPPEGWSEGGLGCVWLLVPCCRAAAVHAHACFAAALDPPPLGCSSCVCLAGGSTPAIAKQLTALGADHVGYASKRFPHLGLSLLGGRPFRCACAGDGCSWHGCCKLAGWVCAHCVALIVSCPPHSPLLDSSPCSKGGRRWSDVAEFFEEHYGIGGHQDSALRMLDVALAAPEEDCKVSGLG